MVQAFGAVSTWTVLSVFIKSPEDTGFCLRYKSGMIKLSRRLRYMLSLLQKPGWLHRHLNTGHLQQVIWQQLPHIHPLGGTSASWAALNPVLHRHCTTLINTGLQDFPWGLKQGKMLADNNVNT